MQPWLTRPADLSKRLLAVALVVLTLGLGLASANERLHRALHTDSDESTCVVCLFAHGLVDSAVTAAVLPVLLLVALFGLPVYQSVLAGRVEFLLPPGRAPPASCSHR